MGTSSTTTVVLCLILLAVSKICTCAEQPNNETSREMFRITDTHLFMTFNSTANQAVSLDYEANLTSLYNGNSGNVYFFNFETGEGVYISGDSAYSWYGSKKDFLDYFDALPKPKAVWDYGVKNGIHLDPFSITPEMSKEIADILSPLSMEFADPCKAYADYVHISKITSDSMKTSLHGFEQIIGTTLTNFRGDFKWLVGIFQGMGALFKNVDGGINILNQKNISLDLGKILTESTGFHVLIYFLTEMSPYFDIGEILGTPLNSPVSLFPLINKLGGDVEYGFDGFINVLSEILMLVKEQSSKQNSQILLNTFYANGNTNFIAVLKEFPSTIQDLLTAVTKLNLIKQLPGLIKTLKDILTNQWYEDGVNMSAVITMVLTNNVLNGNAGIDKILNYIETSKASPPTNITVIPTIPTIPPTIVPKI